MNNKMQYDRIIFFFHYFNIWENEDRKKRKKKENISFVNRCRRSLLFLIKNNKVLTAVIHTVNHLF